jgi:hypothetical protein
MKQLILSLIAAFVAVSCTENERAKNFGGTQTINLPSGQKLQNATWKDTQLWYLTRPMHQDESAETWTFQEKSGFGLVEGKVILKESK